MARYLVQRDRPVRLAATAVIAAVFCACTAQRPANLPGAGQDLAAWSRIGEADWRFADDGVSAGPGETMAYLVSTQTYGDFRLSVEFLIDDETNSGVFVRCTDPGRINPETCYEINIWDNHPNQRWRTGSIVTLMEPLVDIQTVGQWTRCEVEAIGDSVIATFNGITTARLESTRSRDGYIALQYGGGQKLRFRNLRIEPR